MMDSYNIHSGDPPPPAYTAGVPWVGEWSVGGKVEVVGKELFRRIGWSTPDAWLYIK
jgi:hypothetical protein